MPEEIAGTPGWVDERLDELFSPFTDSPAASTARKAYAVCLASRKQPTAPSDTLGAEFDQCRAALHRALQSAGIDGSSLDPGLEALEAEVASGS